MPKKETFTSRFEETRGGRVPQKSKIWGDVFYGWSLMKMIKTNKTGVSNITLGFKNLFSIDNFLGENPVIVSNAITIGCHAQSGHRVKETSS